MAATAPSAGGSACSCRHEQTHDAWLAVSSLDVFPVMLPPHSCTIASTQLGPAPLGSGTTREQRSTMFALVCASQAWTRCFDKVASIYAGTSTDEAALHSNGLQDETGITRVADPWGGSWFMESSSAILKATAAVNDRVKHLLNHAVAAFAGFCRKRRALRVLQTLGVAASSWRASQLA
jgi:hypothetical protein